LEKNQASFFADPARKLGAKLAALLDGDDEAAQPTLKAVNNDTIDLYKEVEKADAAPTAAQMNADRHIESKLSTVLKEWNSLKTKDIPALNLQLPSAGMPEIRLDLPPREEETGENEE